MTKVYKKTTSIAGLALLVTAAFLIQGVIAGWGSKGSFPGPEDPDPTGRFVIFWEEPNNHRAHRLFLKAKDTGHIIPLLDFNRWCEVHWASDGSVLAITDWDGSDYSEIWALSPERPQERINIQRELERCLGEIPSVSQNHHVYFEAIGWVTPKLLRFKIHGYGDIDPRGFERFFEYDRSGSVREISN